MPAKTHHVPDIGQVRLYKRRGVRNIRISLQGDGTIRVTLPAWSSYRMALNFVVSRADWIKQHQVAESLVLRHGQMVGKSHTLEFIPDGVTSPIARVTGNKIFVHHAPMYPVSHSKVQAAAQLACLRALRKQTETLLFPRLQLLASQHGFTYKKAVARKLKSRWGSCSSTGIIALNIYLVQLPWEYIDYVLLHELVHTTHMHHKQTFWDELSKYVPDARTKRKYMRGYQAILIAA